MKENELASLRKSLDVLSRKWHFLILFSLLSGPKRFNEIKRSIGNNISSKSLSTALKSLQLNSLVERQFSDERAYSTSYTLAPRAKELGDVYQSLLRWHSNQPIPDSGLGGSGFL